MSTARNWSLAEGRAGNPAGFPPANYQSFILLANFEDRPAEVRIDFHSTATFGLSRTITVPPRSRYTVRVGGGGASALDSVTEIVDATFAAVVSSFPGRIVVERAMYGDAPGQIWGLGTSAAGSR